MYNYTTFRRICQCSTKEIDSGVNVTIKCKNAQGFISFFVNGDKVRSLYLLGELLRREKRFACWHFSFEEKYPQATPRNMLFLGDPEKVGVAIA